MHSPTWNGVNNLKLVDINIQSERDVYSRLSQTWRVRAKEGRKEGSS